MAAAAWCNVEAEEQDTVFPARSRGFGASDDDSGIANEVKANDAQNVQAKPGWQLPFDCNFCGLAVKSVAEFDQHIHKQEREQQKQQQERRIWCREYCPKHRGPRPTPPGLTPPLLLPVLQVSHRVQ